MPKKELFPIHLKAGHGRTEIKNGSIAIVAEPGKTVQADAKQYRLAMASKIFNIGPAKVKKPDAAKHVRTGPAKTSGGPKTANSDAAADAATPSE